jgi:hypothetical protein
MGQRRKGKVVSDIKQVKRLANPLGKKYSPPPLLPIISHPIFFLSVIDDILKRNLYLSKQPKLDDHHLGKKKKKYNDIQGAVCVVV